MPMLLVEYQTTGAASVPLSIYSQVKRLGTRIPASNIELARSVMAGLAVRVSSGWIWHGCADSRVAPQMGSLAALHSGSTSNLCLEKQSKTDIVYARSTKTLRDELLMFRRSLDVKFAARSSAES